MALLSDPKQDDRDAKPALVIKKAAPAQIILPKKPASKAVARIPVPPEDTYQPQEPKKKKPEKKEEGISDSDFLSKTNSFVWNQYSFQVEKHNQWERTRELQNGLLRGAVVFSAFAIGTGAFLPILAVSVGGLIATSIYSKVKKSTHNNDISHAKALMEKLDKTKGELKGKESADKKAEEKIKQEQQEWDDNGYHADVQDMRPKDYEPRAYDYSQTLKDVKFFSEIVESRTSKLKFWQKVAPLAAQETKFKDERNDMGEYFRFGERNKKTEMPEDEKEDGNNQKPEEAKKSGLAERVGRFIHDLRGVSAKTLNDVENNEQKLQEFMTETFNVYAADKAPDGFEHRKSNFQNKKYWL